MVCLHFRLRVNETRIAFFTRTWRVGIFGSLFAIYNVIGRPRSEPDRDPATLRDLRAPPGKTARLGILAALNGGKGDRSRRLTTARGEGGQPDPPLALSKIRAGDPRPLTQCPRKSYTFGPIGPSPHPDRPCRRKYAPESGVEFPGAPAFPSRIPSRIRGTNRADFYTLENSRTVPGAEKLAFSSFWSVGYGSRASFG